MFSPPNSNSMEQSISSRNDSTRRIRQWSVRALVLALPLLFFALTSSRSPASGQDAFTYTFPEGWSLVSLPLQPDNPSPEAVFSDLPSPLHLYDYVDGLRIGPDDPGFISVIPGRAYWLLLEQERSVVVSGDLVTTSDDYHIILNRGWNLVATPWLATVAWSDDRIAISDGTSTLPLSQAVTQGWVMADLSGYDDALGTYPATSLQPWQGYLLFANISGELIISPPSVDTTPPTVSISSPAEDEEVSGQVDIVGTAQDDSLVRYTLEAASGNGDFVTFATGTTSVVDGHLGTLDTTLLTSGITRLRLTATDLFGNTATTTQNILVVGEKKLGNFSITFVDLEVPVSGIPITIQRTYDSRERGHSGDFGYGWRLEVLKAGTYINNRKPGDGWVILPGGGFLNPPCTIPSETKSHITEIRFSDTEFYRFSFKVDMYGFGSAIMGGCIGDGRFEQIGGVPGATLTLPGGTGIFWLNGTDYITYDLGHPLFGEIYEPTNVRLTTLDGRQFDLNLNQGLTRIADPNGNSLTISSSGATHSAGKSISFSRDGQGRITAVTDPMGNAITYTYDAAGDLVAATDRAGHTTTFGYVDSHFLAEIVDPQGNIPLRNEYDETGRLVAQVDADGNRTEITTDLDADMVTVTDRLGNVIEYEFDDQGMVTKATVGGLSVESTYDERGNILSETDALGNTRSYAYNANDRPTSITDALGHTTALAYSATGHLTSHTDPAGNTTSYSYDASGNLLEVRDTNDQIIESYSYDSSGNPITVTIKGHTTVYTYDTFGNITREQTSSGADRSYTYDANGNRLTETVQRTVNGSPIAETTTYTYDANGNILSLTDPLGNVTSFTYNADGQKLSETDPRGLTTTYEYNGRGELVRTDYADGTFEFYGYDQEGRRTAKIDRAGRTTFFEYDIQGFLTRIIYPDGSAMVNTYDAAGNLIAETDARGNTTNHMYDAGGRRLSTTDPVGNETQFTYSPSGAQLSITDPLSGTTQFQYDESSFGVRRLVQTVYADGSSRQKTYTTSGQVATETDEAGQTTTFAYDTADNLIKVTDALGQETTYTYDEVGNRLSETDANGHTTLFEYDANGRLTSRTLPLGMSETYVYDAAGNLIAHTDFNGETTTFGYDAMNRLLRKTYPDGSEVLYTYTATDQVATVTDDRGLTSYTYDLRDRLVQVEYPDGVTLSFTYDAAGNRTSVTGPDGTTTYTYDAHNRLATVTTPQSGVTVYSYDAAGNRSAISYSNGTETQYTYDVRHRLVTMQHLETDNGTLLAGYEYTLAPAGNRTRLVESGGRIIDYTYDAVYRLVQEEDNLDGSVVTTTYTYDAAGNRLTKERDGDITGYTYDANNRMLTAGSETYTYDANGNTLSREENGNVTLYEYDLENRLVRQTAADGAVTTFAYDDQGNRVLRDVDGDITRFVVDPVDNSGLSQVVAELDAAGDVVAGYVYGDDLIRMRRDGNNAYYHYDGNHSTRFLTDATGDVTDTYAYDAFGNLLASTGSTLNYYLYTGQQYDPNLGFYYLRARYYQPENGRFISMDPFMGHIHDPISLHKYLYAHNNPVNLYDPTGYFALTMAGLSARVTIGQMISFYTPTIVRANILITGITLYWIPGFALRNAALEELSSGVIHLLDDSAWEAAMHKYRLGAFLIQIGASAMTLADQVTGYMLSGIGFIQMIRAVQNAPRLTVTSMQYKRFELAYERLEISGSSLIYRSIRMSITEVRVLRAEFTDWSKAIWEGVQFFSSLK